MVIQLKRVYNFSAGPSVLPLPVLEKAQTELLCYQDTGMSVMEMSHRSAAFEGIIQGAESLLRELMQIPDNYHVLFLQGGASTLFAMVPLNLFRSSKKADYIHTGSWSKKAIAEAKKYGDVRIIASSEDKNYSYIPAIDASMIDPEADYVHITTNNTIEGTYFPDVPDTNGVPLVADMSSNFLSQPYDVSKFGMIYAGAQKNLGPAGLTIAIVRDDLLGYAAPICPTMLDLQTHAKGKSLYNTPPAYSIYVAKLVLEWLKEFGGIEKIYQQNQEKAAMLYDFIDQSKIFSSPVEKSARSLMNIPFVLPTEALNKQFIKESAENGLANLKGHRSVGGMRASIYNAMPVAGVEALVNFMKQFEAKVQEEA